MKNQTVSLERLWASELTTNSKIIVAFILASESEASYSGFPLVVEIMKGCSMSKTTVHKNLNLLLLEEWIIRGRSLKGSRRNYSINKEKLGQFMEIRIQPSESITVFGKEHFYKEFFSNLTD
ncbi:MAG: hypothetical protein CBD32_02975 [Actinobacteria bacterium TMED172]|nr:hypothetical protein [Cellvibrionales bacterium]OUW33428.1 MAG: hypothetical protein CBD32_02975 [Actinobacteria bacterium TMED172]